MPFNLTIPRSVGKPLNLTINLGEHLFILGANGTGKSSLMQRLYTPHHDNARQISAHRQTWFSSNTITLSPQQKRDMEVNIRGRDTSLESRWKDDYAAFRASISIYDLIDIYYHPCLQCLVQRHANGLLKLAYDGSILAIPATLLVDYRTYYDKLEALCKALFSLGDEETAKIISSVLAQRLNPGMDFNHKLTKIVHRDIERLSETNNEDLKHGVKLSCFFSNRWWAEMVQVPNYIDDSIEYAESRVPGLIAIIQQLYLTKWS